MKWREFAKRLLLVDNRISDLETVLLKRAVLADGVVDREEIEFMLDLKRSAGSVHPEFDLFLNSVLKKLVLGTHGEITDAEARWLDKVLFSDRQISEAERCLIRDLRKEAKKSGPAFEALVKRVMNLQETEFSRA